MNQPIKPIVLEADRIVLDGQQFKPVPTNCTGCKYDTGHAECSHPKASAITGVPKGEIWECYEHKTLAKGSMKQRMRKNSDVTYMALKEKKK